MADRQNDRGVSDRDKEALSLIVSLQQVLRLHFYLNDSKQQKNPVLVFSDASYNLI